MFRKKEKVSERNPINLPGKPPYELSAREIANHLRNDENVITWISLFDIQDGFAVYSMKDDLILSYAWDFEDKENELKLRKIRLATTDSFLDLWEDDFSKVRKIYFDSENRISELTMQKTVIDYEKIKNKLHGNEVYFVKDSDFKKNGD